MISIANIHFDTTTLGVQFFENISNLVRRGDPASGFVLSLLAHSSKFNFGAKFAEFIDQTSALALPDVLKIIKCPVPELDRQAKDFLRNPVFSKTLLATLKV